MNDLISRQVAIKALTQLRIESMLNHEDVSKIWECEDAIAQCPSVSAHIAVQGWRRMNTSDDDLISRQAVLERIREYIEEYSDLETNGDHNLKWCAMKEAEDVILTESSIQPELWGEN